jgi:glycosyltransferase involved in cell wall biosynthesis
LGPRAARTRRTYDALFVLHDAALSRLAWPRQLDAIYAYEDGALRTFQRAYRAGLGRFWDSPAIHWRAAERIWEEESKRWPGAMGAHLPVEEEWKKRRKDEELDLADVVFVASRFARGTLEDEGCRKPLVQVPYGFPVELFRPKAGQADGPFTVLAVGVHDLRKGTPYLLEAWRLAGIRKARLRLVGPMKLTPVFLSRYEGLFEHVPYLPRLALEREYQAADLLAFPTLGDGFGLVMQEAMCCATPVLTTPHGGGPECITDGVEGWLIPARDVGALVEKLREAAIDREHLVRMGIMARIKAERYSWQAAEERLAQSITRTLVR